MSTYELTTVSSCDFMKYTYQFSEHSSCDCELITDSLIFYNTSQLGLHVCYQCIILYCFRLANKRSDCNFQFVQFFRLSNIEKFLSGSFPGQSQQPEQGPKGCSLRLKGPKVEAEGQSRGGVLREGAWSMTVLAPGKGLLGICILDMFRVFINLASTWVLSR